MIYAHKDINGMIYFNFYAVFMLFVLVVDFLFSSAQKENSVIIYSPLCQLIVR